MPNVSRTRKAEEAAASYAPSPNGSALTYGLIAASLVFIGALVVGAFYAVDIIANPWPLVGTTGVVFLLGAAVRIWKRRVNRKAVATEYASSEPVGSTLLDNPDIVH